MLGRINGLHGWVEHNDRRSIALFACFIVAINMGAVLVLTLPLLALDPGHAPLVAWEGYAARYIPLVTLTAGIGFGLQMLWHVKVTQRTLSFRFVDDADEPRLCGLLEPLAIGMGVPTPYVGVIETGALNAFACGTTRRDAVVVVTRGLIDELDDDELGAVLAHELAHMANGDIRLLAAANACLRIVGLMIRPRLKTRNRFQELTAFPAVMLAMPPLFVFALLTSFSAQSALRGSRLVRLLIASSREFVADARAVEATHNPAALVSALQRISGRSRLAGILPGQDAMMIDGSSAGEFATHPPLARRIDAIVATTGAIALIAPTRRDTRPKVALAPRGSHIRASMRGAVTMPADLPDESAGPDDRNWLGLTPTMSLGAALAVLAFVVVHRADLGAPARMAATLDPRPASALLAVAGRATACNVGAVAALAGGPDRFKCNSGAMNGIMAEQAKVGGPVGTMLAAMSSTGDGTFAVRSTAVVETDDATAAEITAKRCFRTDPYGRGDRGLFRVNDETRTDGGLNIRLWLARASDLAYAVNDADLDALPEAIEAYVAARKLNYEMTDRFFGADGLAFARQAYASVGHDRALGRIRDHLADPALRAHMSSSALAEARLLAMAPDDFVSCVARTRDGA